MLLYAWSIWWWRGQLWSKSTWSLTVQYHITQNKQENNAYYTLFKMAWYGISEKGAPDARTEIGRTAICPTQSPLFLYYFCPASRASGTPALFSIHIPVSTSLVRFQHLTLWFLTGVCCSTYRFSKDKHIVNIDVSLTHCMCNLSMLFNGFLIFHHDFARNLMKIRRFGLSGIFVPVNGSMRVRAELYYG